MTEPQQPAAPLEVADPEPALPEPEAIVEPSATADGRSPTQAAIFRNSNRWRRQRV